MIDIVYARPEPYLVVGFFTPDYQELAADFSRNLSSFSVPHHIYAVSQEKWDSAILLKPTIVLRAMKDYPAHKLVLMDVDCQLRGDIGPWVNSQTSDITLPARIRKGSRRHGRVLFSSRVMVIAPTRAAKNLVTSWESHCASAKAPMFGRLCDERELVAAVGSLHGATISFSFNQYAGLDVHNAPVGAKIVHVSEHGKRHDTIFTSLGKLGQKAFDVLRGKAYQS